ncbi:hypothetical protein C2G38_2052723 [Gigaspora rosea]|uniref:Uncharacterized protein n=1 Tax=Gigaspora rosea TaxID=44941 RepID=A0A397WDZ3_9GLOM|nr:hypothetical protein C2G38_2052723 [Gigaspora rosea]
MNSVFLNILCAIISILRLFGFPIISDYEPPLVILFSHIKSFFTYFFTTYHSFIICLLFFLYDPACWYMLVSIFPQVFAFFVIAFFKVIISFSKFIIRPPLISRFFKIIFLLFCAFVIHCAFDWHKRYTYRNVIIDVF